MNTSIKSKPFEKMPDNLASHMEPAASWQPLTGYYWYRQQLNSLTKLLDENNVLSPLTNFENESGSEPRVLVLVVGGLVQRGYVSLYGYPREITPELDAPHKIGPNLTVPNDMVTSRPYAIEILQQVLTFTDEKNLNLYLAQPSLMNMMEQADYRTFQIANQQTMTACNTVLMVFSCQIDKQYYMNQQHAQSAREYDANVLKPFQEVLKDPAPKKLIIAHLSGTYIKYECHHPEDQGKFDGNMEYVPPGLNAEELESYNDYDSANLYSDHVVANLIKDFKTTDSSDPLAYFFNHGEEVYDTPPHKTQGCNESSPIRHTYTIPPLLWTPGKWQVIHPRGSPQDVDRKYSLAELIHTRSDLAGLSYDGCGPTRSVVNPQLKETARWIGNPYKKNALIDYDTLPYDDQVGNR